MSLDDRILLLQRAIDRLVRRLRRGGAPQPTRRRFLIVQIDGLSRDVLDEGLRSGHMPFLKPLLRRHGYRLEPVAVCPPTPPPGFPIAGLYAVDPHNPAFP